MLTLLHKEFANDAQYTFELKKVFSKPEGVGNSYFSVDLAVLLRNKLIMVISKADRKEELEKLFYHFQSYCSDATYYVVLYSDQYICKEAPYCKSTPQKNIYEFDDFPHFNIIKTNTINKEYLINLIKCHDDLRYIKHEQIRDFLMKCAQNHKISSVIPVINEICEDSFEYNNHYVWLDSKTEDKLITSLLNAQKEIPNLLYRYTSMSSLDYLFNTNEKVHSMSSLVTMNDPTEIDYANNYLNNAGVNIERYSSEFDRKNSIHSYITSLTELKDDLTLWRLYGEDSKGICIEYEVGNTELLVNYVLARVSYADKDKKNLNLEFIADLLKGIFHERRFVLRRWREWQHFFKPYEYAVEEEVRLLTYVDDVKFSSGKLTRKWITTPNGIYAPLLNIPFSAKKDDISYPLSIHRIIFGSKFHEKEANRITWEFKIKDEYSNCISKDFQICISKIDNYR